MATSALKTIKASKVVFASNGSTTDMISSTHTEELVIALCGPIGSPLHDVGDAIRTMLLDSFGYNECT